MKSQKSEKQKDYKEFLDKQMASQAERELLNKMTKNEKKLNFNDLQAYKGYDSKMFSLIPGFINSKYTNPLGGPESFNKSPGKGHQGNDMYNLGETEQRNSHYESSPAIQNSPSKAQTQLHQNVTVDSPYMNYQPEYKTLEGLSSSPARERLFEMRQQQYETQERSQPIQPQFQKEEVRQPAAPSYNSSSPQFVPSNTYGGFSSPQSGMPAQDSYKSMTDMSSYFKKSHNPITNPLPVNVQNPYIAKEMNKVIQKQPYFANMATNNLIG